MGIDMSDYESTNGADKYYMHLSYDNNDHIILEHDRDTKSSTITIIIHGIETIIRADEHGIITTDDIHDEHIREITDIVIGLDNAIENMATV
jgi:hypothetical protein